MQPMLSARQPAPIVSVEDEYAPFDPKQYLDEYYTQLGPENRELLNFNHLAYLCIFSELRTARMLELGGGPTIYQLISAARYPIAIDFSDYLDANLNELRIWLEDRPGQFRWEPFIRYVLEREGTPACGCALEQRAREIRRKVRRLLHCDARRAAPLGEGAAQYDIVSINFVLEAVAHDVVEWDRLLDHVQPLIKPGGYLLMGVVTGAEHYRVGRTFFPTIPLSCDYVVRKLRRRRLAPVLHHFVPAERQDEQGYQGLFMILARTRSVAAWR